MNADESNFVILVKWITTHYDIILSIITTVATTLLTIIKDLYMFSYIDCIHNIPICNTPIFPLVQPNSFNRTHGYSWCFFNAEINMWPLFWLQFWCVFDAEINM